MGWRKVDTGVCRVPRKVGGGDSYFLLRICSADIWEPQIYLWIWLVPICSAKFIVPVNSNLPEVIYNWTMYEQITNLTVYHKMCRHVWIFPEPYETIPHVGWQCCSWKRGMHTYCSIQAITGSSACMQRGSGAGDSSFNWLLTAGA